VMGHGGKRAGQRPRAERGEYQSAENSHSDSVTGEAGGVARIVSCVMDNFDVRKADHPDYECAEQSREYRGDSVGSGDGLGPGIPSGADDLRLHGIATVVVVVGTILYLIRPVPRQSRYR
jgi:hypothetical protein